MSQKCCADLSAKGTMPIIKTWPKIYPSTNPHYGPIYDVDDGGGGVGVVAVLVLVMVIGRRKGFLFRVDLFCFSRSP